MHATLTTRSLAVVASLAVVLTAGWTGAVAAQAAEPYSAPLRTAVRALVVAAEHNAGYDRDRQFGGWIDADSDCQSTRHEVLAAESQVTPTLSAGGCTVTAGRWVPFYDDRVYPAATQLDIDHMVPLAEAWGSGAQAWTQQQRVAFANDLGDERSLNAMPSGLNAAKGASGPEQWLPPANVCRYIAVWTAIKLRWALTVDAAEQAALVRHADACPDTTVTVETVGTGTTPTTPPPAGPPPTQIAAGTQTIDDGGTVALAVLGEAGAVVDLYASSVRAPARVIRTTTLTTRGTGGFRWNLQPGANSRVATWSLQPGETTRLFAQVRGGDRTATLTVVVRRTVTIGIRQAAGVYTFTGVARRPVAGLQVTLARLLTSGRVVGVASTTTNAAGAYTIRTRLAPGMGGYYALTAATPGLQPGRSRLYGLVVPAPRTAAPAPAPVRPPSAPTVPPRPADVDCSDFTTRAAAQAFHDRYFPYYGDVARLDADDDGRACESLP